MTKDCRVMPFFSGCLLVLLRLFIFVHNSPLTVLLKALHLTGAFTRQKGISRIWVSLKYKAGTTKASRQLCGLSCVLDAAGLNQTLQAPCSPRRELGPCKRSSLSLVLHHAGEPRVGGHQSFTHTTFSK